jgi:lysine-specific demethylase 8
LWAQQHAGLSPCGPAVLHLLDRARDCPVPTTILPLARRLHRLADEKILSYPYKDVPVCWRRLYTDAALLEAVATLLADGQELAAIEKLDMALVVAGAPGRGRAEAVYGLIAELQRRLPSETDDPPRPTKRLKLDGQRARVLEPMVERPIPRFDVPPALDVYLRDLLLSPFIVTAGASQWPALVERPWSDPAYLARVAGPGRVVPVEVGGTYTAATWTQQIMPFATFLRRIGLSFTSPDEQGKADGDALLYLAQHDLFRQLPSLADDILVPDYLYAAPPATADVPDYAPPDTDSGYILNAWLGPAGTTSPAHTDPYYNCFGAPSCWPTSMPNER